MNLKPIVSKSLLYLTAVFILFVTGFPYLFMMNTAFKGQFEFMTAPFSLPVEWKIENFTSLFTGQFMTYFFNSVVVSSLSVILVIIFAAMVSFPLARMKFRLNKPLFLLFIIGMMIPIHTTLIPIYVLTQRLGLYDTIWGLLGPYIAFALPISIFIFHQFMREIPVELEEAARMDGCGDYRLFWKVMFPMLTPAISTVTIYNFIHIWNEFVFALVLTSDKNSATLPLGLKQFYGEFSIDVPAIMAALLLASLPLIFVYLLAQEKVVKGLSAGSVKG